MTLTDNLARVKEALEYIGSLERMSQDDVRRNQLYPLPTEAQMREKAQEAIALLPSIMEEVERMQDARPDRVNEAIEVFCKGYL